MPERFISVILEPGKIWTEHIVVDVEKQVAIAKCTRPEHADLIAKILNQHKEERAVRALLT